MKKNKLMLLVLALILLSGIIVVCLKGFNVSLDLRAHDTLKFVFDKKFEMSDVTKICNEVFKDKEYEVKTVEVFSDAVYIISPEISKSEEETLLEKLDELYKEKEDSKKEETTTDETETTPTDEENKTTSDEEKTEEEKTIFDELEEGTKYDLHHDSKVRIRDIVKPYIIPSIICAIIIVLYIAIKYRKLGNWFFTVCKTLGEMLLILLEVMAIIAITRIPFTTTLVPIILFIVVICLCIRLEIYERQLEKLDE